MTPPSRKESSLPLTRLQAGALRNLVCRRLEVSSRDWHDSAWAGRQLATYLEMRQVGEVTEDRTPVQIVSGLNRRQARDCIDRLMRLSP